MDAVAEIPSVLLNLAVISPEPRLIFPSFGADLRVTLPGGSP